MVIAEFAPQDRETDLLLDKYLRRSLFLVVDVTPAIALKARELVRRFKGSLQGRDAVHLATAIYAEAEALHTRDKGLLNIAEDVSELKICQPEWPFRQITLEQLAVTKDTGFHQKRNC